MKKITEGRSVSCQEQYKSLRKGIEKIAQSLDLKATAESLTKLQDPPTCEQCFVDVQSMQAAIYALDEYLSTGSRLNQTPKGES